MKPEELLVIYKATNTINKKIYIGQTTLGLAARLGSHLHAARHSKNNKTPFIRSIQKYGETAYIWEELAVATTLDELNLLEIKFIKDLDSHIDKGKGYNVKYGGDNHKHCEATKKKIGDAQRGDKNHMWGIKGVDNHSSKPLIDLLSKKSWDSVTECSESIGASITKIAAVARGTRFSVSSNGTMYIPRYLDELGCIKKVGSLLPNLGRGNKYFVGGKVTWVLIGALSSYWEVTHAFITSVTKGDKVDKYGRVWSRCTDVEEFENMLISVPSSSIYIL